MFNYTDHLGNVRLSYAQNPSTKKVEILEENNYYPFGLKHQGYNTLNLQAGYKYKYNGKELQEELGLDVYDYGARNYDAAIGRWMNIDPLAEMSRRYSPYTYALNNPVYFIDPDGMMQAPNGGSSYDFKNNPPPLDSNSFLDDSRFGFRAAESGIDPSKKGEGTDTGNAQYTGDDGLPNGVDKPAEELNEVIVGNSKSINIGDVGSAVTLTNIYTEALAAISKDNASLVMKYGTVEVSAAELTIRNSTRMTMIAGRAGIAGKVLGGVGLGVTGYQYATGQITSTEASIDVIMGTVGFLGPIGAVTSLTYFAGKAIYEYSSGETLFEKPKN
ncbi:hypothetical protein OA88_10375 [Flavobacterium sp. JRM]|nr:hypothetical protein OA88_10375 [Flavobacterium sp. JRM]